MDIAFLPRDKRLMRRVKVNENVDNLNEDSFWLATIIKISPRREKYLYMCNPKTTYAIVHKLGRNWKKELKENIEKAFRREFETLKERGVSVGKYEEFLDTINFTTVPDQYFAIMKNFEKSKANYEEVFYSNFVPREYFIKEIVVDNLNLYINSFERESPLKPPWERIEELFENYQGSVEKKEVSFEENALALEIPVYKNKSTTKNLMKLKDAQPIYVDDTSLSFKEPVKNNRIRFKKVNKKLENLVRDLDIDNITEQQEKRLQSLLDKASSYLTYIPAPYTGRYKELKVPEKMPERPVFEFLITLLSGAFPVLRRVAVSADMEFTDFDRLMSHLFRWGGFPYHLSEFIFPLKNSPEGKNASEVLIWQKEDLPEEGYLKPTDINYLDAYNPFYNVPHTDIKGKKLKDYFPKFKTAQYRYDFGDNWYHSIELIGIHDQDSFGKELPYLIDSIGVAPIDDIGGQEGFYKFINYDFDYFGVNRYRMFGNEWAHERELILQTPCSLAPLFK